MRHRRHTSLPRRATRIMSLILLALFASSAFLTTDAQECDTICELCSDGTEPGVDLETCDCLPCIDSPSGLSCSGACELCSDSVTLVCPDPDSGCELELCPVAAATCRDLTFGDTSFGVFAKQDISIERTTVRSTLASGGSIYLKNFHAAGDVLAKEDVEVDSGAVCGDIIYGDSFQGSKWGFKCQGDEKSEGELKQEATTLPFESASERFGSISSCLFANAPCTGEATLDKSTLTFEHSEGETEETYCITCDDLQAARKLQFIGFPEDGNAIVNVYGMDSCMFYGKTMEGLEPSKLLWNFEAANMIVYGKVTGTVMAPFSDVINPSSKNWGWVDGQVIVNNWDANLRVYDKPYEGCVPNYCT